MVAIQKGFTQAQSQLFAIGIAILAEAKAKKTRAEVQKANDDLVKEYLATGVKTLEELSKAILADGQTDPKWKKEDGKFVGYQKAIAAGSPGAAGYNSFRSWCAKWFDENLTKLTPEQVKAKNAKTPPEGDGEGAEGDGKTAGETAKPLTEVPTEILIAELKIRAKAGDEEAMKFFA